MTASTSLGRFRRWAGLAGWSELADRRRELLNGLANRRASNSGTWFIDTAEGTAKSPSYRPRYYPGPFHHHTKVKIQLPSCNFTAHVRYGGFTLIVDDSRGTDPVTAGLRMATLSAGGEPDVPSCALWSSPRRRLRADADGTGAAAYQSVAKLHRAPRPPHFLPHRWRSRLDPRTIRRFG